MVITYDRINTEKNDSCDQAFKRGLKFAEEIVRKEDEKKFYRTKLLVRAYLQGWI